MNWFKKKVECVQCKKVQTKREFEGQATCPECRMNILCSREPKRNCPADGTLLIKAYNAEEIIIDRCPKCKGIWLDADELGAIKEAERQAASSGLCTGIMIGTMIN